MKLYVSLFGKNEELLGWLELFEQEKIPFRRGVCEKKEFSAVNILVGDEFTENGIKSFINPQRSYILEPSSKKETKGTRLSDLKIKQKKNLLIFSKNISTLLTENNNERNKILSILRNALIKGFNSINLPYFHLWYYPQSCKTILLFRQDVDYVDENGLKNLIKITSRFKIKGTYFINISGEEEFDEKIGHLKLLRPTTPERKENVLILFSQGNEMANHGYWHWVFKDFKNNYKNIERCSNYLNKSFKIDCQGFAAPGGEWNENLAKAIDKNKLLYSCNGISNGGFPYHPYCEGKKTKALEIPFYFLCDASFEPLNHEYKWIIDNNQKKYLKTSYLNYIKNQIKTSEPIGIFGHPHIIGKSAVNFYSPIFKNIKTLKIPSFTIKKFANWWKKREGIKLNLAKLDDQLIINSNKIGFYIELVFNKKKKLIKIDKRKMAINLLLFNKMVE